MTITTATSQEATVPSQTIETATGVTADARIESSPSAQLIGANRVILFRGSDVHALIDMIAGDNRSYEAATYEEIATALARIVTDDEHLREYLVAKMLRRAETV